MSAAMAGAIAQTTAQVRCTEEGALRYGRFCTSYVVRRQNRGPKPRWFGGFAAQKPLSSSCRISSHGVPASAAAGAIESFADAAAGKAAKAAPGPAGCWAPTASASHAGIAGAAATCAGGGSFAGVTGAGAALGELASTALLGAATAGASGGTAAASAVSARC